MRSVQRHRTFVRPRPGGARALTLVECLIALTILGALTLAVMATGTAAHQHLREGSHELLAIRLARDLAEEVLGQAYEDPQTPGNFGPEVGELARTAFDDLDDYHGYTEAPGQIRDATGALYPAELQEFSRRVAVTSGNGAISQLGLQFSGRTVTITVADQEGRSWTFVRFVPQPLP